ncbi:MAG: hypothetical protein K2O39_00690, partial [Clostridiales bacterium]|nr:hypothetical protein [Clostridiales bacterium]
DVQWVKWVHPRIPPATTSFEKKMNAVVASIIPIHCAKCLNMNGCCFAENKCPEEKFHDNCHCKTERIENLTVKAECPIEKFTEYIFNDFYKDGKEQIFKNLGYTISDSATLKSEMEKQAYSAYLSGEYELGTLDSYGQRINIYVTLTSKNGKQVTFKTGWMTYPDGKILLTTPFGGKV